MPEQTKITGGVVRFSMRLCPKQYEHKESNVELTFTVGETDDYEAVFDRASRAVVNRVRQMVDLPPFDTPTKAEVVADVKKTTGLYSATIGGSRERAIIEGVEPGLFND